METLFPWSSTSSIGTTASAPSGTVPPVAMPAAAPEGNGPDGGVPAATRKATESSPGVSAARTANPSIAELGKGGRSTRERGASRSTRPFASSSATISVESGRAWDRICSSASSTVSSCDCIDSGARVPSAEEGVVCSVDVVVVVVVLE